MVVVAETLVKNYCEQIIAMILKRKNCNNYYVRNMQDTILYNNILSLYAFVILWTIKAF